MPVFPYYFSLTFMSRTDFNFMFSTNSTKRKVIATTMLLRHKWHSTTKKREEKHSKVAIYTAFFCCIKWCMRTISLHTTSHRRRKIQPKFRKALMTSIGKFYSTENICVKIKLGKLEQQKYYKREKRKAGGRERENYYV